MKTLKKFILMSLPILIIALFSLQSRDKFSASSTAANACGIYCVMAENAASFYREKSFCPYFLQKSFESQFIFFFRNLLLQDDHQKLTDHVRTNTMLEAYSWIMVLVALFFWIKIAKHFEWSNRKTWFSYILVFLSYPFLKVNPYFQELPDTMAFALSLIFFYYWLKKKEMMQFLCIAISSFVMPQFKFFAIPLYILKREKTFKVDKLGQKTFHLIVMSVIGAAIVAIYIFPKRWYALGRTEIQELLLPGFWSLVMVFALSIKKLISHDLFIDFQYIKNIIIKKNLIIILAWQTFVTVFVMYFGRGTSLAPASWFYVLFFLYGTAQFPLRNIGQHVLYFGPVILFSFVYWSAIVSKVQSYGIGMQLAFLVFFLLAIDCESRHLIGYIALFLVFTISSINDEIITNRVLILFSIVCAIWSRVFVTFNSGLIDWVTLNSGPWVKPQWHLCILVIVVVCFAGVYLLANKIRFAKADIE